MQLLEQDKPKNIEVRRTSNGVVLKCDQRMTYYQVEDDAVKMLITQARKEWSYNHFHC